MLKLMHIAIFLLLALILAAPAAMAQNTYYISNSKGSDSNSSTQAQSKTSPWQHAPGMPGASGNANSYNPVAGDKFVFMGCDTWTFNAQWEWAWGGSSSNHIVIGGLDQTWYNTSVCPTAWNRPIFTGGGTWPGSTAAFMLSLDGGYVEVAWIEWKGFYYNSVNTSNEIGIIALGDGGNRLIDNNYFHGWSHASGASENEDVNTIYQGAGTDRIAYNAFDGADTDQHSFGGIYGGSDGEEVDHNYFAYQNDTMNFDASLVHDNTFFNAGTVDYPGSGDHNNVMESNQDPAAGMFVYNNYYVAMMGGANCGDPVGTDCSGVGAQIAPPAGTTSYFFNNVITDSGNTGNILMCEQSITNSGGTCLFFNNTEECGPDSTGSNGECLRLGGLSGTLPTMTLANMHMITNISTPTGTTAVVQTLPVANAQGYTISQTYSFSPVASTDATVGTGTNMASTCAKISAVNAAAGTACLNDTTYGVVYNTTTHQITGSGRVPVVRPASGPWDVGAYQFSGASSASKPNPPTGLTVIVK